MFPLLLLLFFIKNQSSPEWWRHPNGVDRVNWEHTALHSLSLEFWFPLGDTWGPPTKRSQPAPPWQSQGSWGFTSPRPENNTFYSLRLSARNLEVWFTTVAPELSFPIWQLCVSLPCSKVQLREVSVDDFSALAVDRGPLTTARPALPPEKPVKE